MVAVDDTRAQVIAVGVQGPAGAGGVASVNTRTGAVVLTASNVNLGLVNKYLARKQTCLHRNALRNLARWVEHLYPIAGLDRGDGFAVAMAPDLLADWLVDDLTEPRAQRVLEVAVRAAADFPQAVPLVSRVAGADPAHRAARTLLLVIRLTPADPRMDQVLAELVPRAGLDEEQARRLDFSVHTWMLPRTRVALAEVLVAHARARADAADLAGWLNGLGIRLSVVGWREEALAPATEAVEIYRRLAEANPAAHLPSLATSLDNLGRLHHDLGAHGLERATARESLAVTRRMAEMSPDLWSVLLESRRAYWRKRLAEHGDLPGSLTLDLPAPDDPAPDG